MLAVEVTHSNPYVSDKKNITKQSIYFMTADLYAIIASPHTHTHTHTLTHTHTHTHTHTLQVEFSVKKNKNHQKHFLNLLSAFITENMKYRPLLWSKWQHARLSRSGPGFDPRSGQVSWVRFFSGFFLNCKTNVWKLQATKVPEYHLAVVIIIPYSSCWDD